MVWKFVCMELAGEGRVVKRFRVAREGQTVDGRELLRKEIQEMADSYDPELYAGRINVEHIAGWSPEPPFNAYGDIIKVEAVEENGKLCLYNTISALPNFVRMNKSGQKIYPSIEFYRNFAGTGKAYQTGLGMTDEPASLGTQAIKFSNHLYAVRTQPDVEIFMSNTAPNDQNSPIPHDAKGLMAQLKEILTPQVKKEDPMDEDFKATMTQGLVCALNGIKDLNDKFSSIHQQSMQTTTPAVEAVVTTPSVQTTVPEQTASDQFSQAMQHLLTAITGLQTDLQKLSTTPVNIPPSMTGGDAEKIDY